MASVTNEKQRRLICRLAHCTDMRWIVLGLMEGHSWGGPAHVGEGIDDGWWCCDWGKQCSWSVDVLAGIVSNERGLNEIRDSPSVSPTSRVFPHVLKSPRRVCRRIISTPGARTHWCMCYSRACGSSWCFRTAWGLEAVAGRFVLHPKVQTTPWRAGDIKRVSETLEARGRRRASG